ncbi:hypothetical protein [Telluribacter sp.]|jgi:hypothetical protein|uniref:hypothetical protein n=1 Tax=Telluribacter sp. TaxID=1978767 RepID=UPI002E150AD0|nr:hypothetical protein [Telluribacter sp.]
MIHLPETADTSREKRYFLEEIIFSVFIILEIVFMVLEMIFKGLLTLCICMAGGAARAVCCMISGMVVPGDVGGLQRPSI